MDFSHSEILRNICKLLSDRLIINAVLSYILVGYVECKHCTYFYESGHVKHFFCNAYEYCCGPLCCRSRSIGFFQLWYFWLMIILMLMLCSGGGWWYKFRYRNQFPQSGPNFAVPSNTAGFRPFAYRPGMQNIGQPAPYPMTGGPGPIYPPQQGGVYPPNVTGVHLYPQPPMAGAYPTMSTPYPAQPMVAMPPPPYTGPPPSYAVATTGNPSFHADKVGE